MGSGAAQKESPMPPDPSSPKKLGPSYEQGRLRDPEIVRKQDATYRKGDLERLIRKTAPPKRSPSS